METSERLLPVILLLILSSFTSVSDSAATRGSKPGLCPVFPGLPNCDGTRDSCRGDYDCIRTEKCCTVGCKKICLDPSEVQVFASGDKTCPALPRPARCSATQNECLMDSDCASPLKCCSDGCSYKCVQPVITPTATPLETKTCQTVVDLAFLVDSSGSITKTNYKKLKAFIIYIVRSFEISLRGSHAAVILYSNSASVKVNFNQFYSTENVVQVIRSLPHERGLTRIDRALTLAAQLFQGARKNVPRIAMVLTDGEQTKSPDAMNLRDASAPLRAAGVRVLAYGIAKRVNKRELRLMVERDQDVINVQSFDGLIKNTKSLTSSICQASSTEPIHQDSDIIFLMDSSTGVTMPQYDLQKDFVRGLTRQFLISPLGPRAALMTYSSRAETVIEFSGFNTVPDFSVKINDSPFLGGQRRIDVALESAAKMFREKSRPGGRILVLLTAGNYHMDLGVAMQQLMSLDAHVYVVGIGSAFNSTSHRLMVRAPRDIFIAPSFDALSSVQQDVARRVRLGATASSQERSDFSADVVFLMDSSADVNEKNYNIEKNYVKLMAKLLNLNQKGSRAAVYLYSYYTRLINTFGHDEYEAFAAAVNEAPHLGGSRRYSVAFQAAVQMIRSSRNNVPKFVVLITAGGSARLPDDNLLSALSKPLRDLGAQVFVIGVRPGFDARDFLSVVDGREDIFPVTSFDGMLPVASPMARHMMASWGLRRIPRYSRFTADIIFVMDASQIVKPAQYNEEKEYIKMLYKAISGQHGLTRAGLVVYGYDQLILLGLDGYKNISSLETNTDRAPYLGGVPRIGRALSTVATLFEQARPDVPWIAVLLTTGKLAPGAMNWKEAMEPLRERGVWPYVVTIGEHVTPTEVGSALMDRNDAVAASSFRDLPLLVGQVAQHITTDKFIHGPPSHTLDVVFLLDSSSAVSPTNFKVQTDYTKRLSWHLGIMQGDSRGAVISYGNVPDVVLTFNDYKNASKFLTTLDESPAVGGERRIDRALETAAVVSLQSRSRIPKAVVLFTAGKQVNNRTLEDAIAPLRKLGIWIFVISVGSEPDVQELQKVTINAEDIFQVKSLMSNIGGVARRMMNTTRVSFPPTYVRADIVFIVDASKGMPFEQYRDEKNFVLLTARYLNIDLDISRAALVVYGFKPFVRFGFEDNNGDFAEFTTSVIRAPYIGGERRTGLAVETAMDLLLKERVSVPKIAVLLTAGKPSGIETLETILRPLHFSDVRTYVVYTGSGMTHGEILSAVEKPQDAFIIQEYRNMHQQAMPLARHVNFDSVVLAPLTFGSDVVFLLDSSRDVSFIDFYLEKNFVRFLGRYLRISPKHSRAGLVSYGEKPSVITNLGAYNTTGEFYGSLERADSIGGIRRLDRVLDTATAMFSSARPAVPKVLILFTAGNQIDGSEVGAIDAALQRLESIGVKLYVISVGKRDARVKVVKPSDMFEVRSYRNLPTVVLPLAMHTFIDTASLGPPDFKADIVFMVDTSTKVSPQNYKLEKNFVKLIARYLNISPGKSHAAFIVYNTNPAVVSPLETFTSTWGFVSAINRASYLGGGRRIDRALSSAAYQLENARPSARKIAILLTAGNQLGGLEIGALEDSVSQLKKVGVITYVITIGSGTGTGQLTRIVDKPEDVFQVGTYQLLPLRVEPVAQHIASQKEALRYPADIVFIVDASENDAGKYRVEKDFVKSMARYFNVGRFTSRASLLIFNETSIVVVKFADYNSTGEFIDAIDGAPLLGGSRRTDLALEAAVTLFLESRLSASRVAFLVTMGTTRDGPNAKPLSEAVQNLRSLGVRTYVGVFGTEADLSGFRSVVEDNKDLFLLPLVSSEIPDSVQRVGSHVAQGTPRPLNLTMQLVFMLDSSDRITAQDYREQKNFIKNLVRTLNVYPGGSEAVVVVYSDEPSIVLKLKGQTSKSFDEEVDRLQQLSGIKRIDKAVDAAENLLKSVDSPVKKYVILLTKGRQENPPDAKTLLSRLGAKSLVVSFGDIEDSKDEQDSVSVRSSSVLENYVDPISRRVMEAYVAPRSITLSSCLEYGEVKCNNVESNECHSDSDCANSNQRCCFNGCKNVCYDPSSVTPRVAGSGLDQSTSVMNTEQTTTIPTTEPNTSYPTTTTRTTDRMTLTTGEVTDSQTTSSKEDTSTLPSSTNQKSTPISTEQSTPASATTKQVIPGTEDTMTLHVTSEKTHRQTASSTPLTSTNNQTPVSTGRGTPARATTTQEIPSTADTTTFKLASDEVTTHPKTTSSTPQTSTNEQTPASTDQSTSAPETTTHEVPSTVDTTTLELTSDEVTTHPKTTSSTLSTSTNEQTPASTDQSTSTPETTTQEVPSTVDTTTLELASDEVTTHPKTTSSTLSTSTNEQTPASTDQSTSAPDTTAQEVPSTVDTTTLELASDEVTTHPKTTSSTLSTSTNEQTPASTDQSTSAPDTTAKLVPSTEDTTTAVVTSEKATTHEQTLPTSSNVQTTPVLAERSTSAPATTTKLSPSTIDTTPGVTSDRSSTHPTPIMSSESEPSTPPTSTEETTEKGITEVAAEKSTEVDDTTTEVATQVVTVTESPVETRTPPTTEGRVATKATTMPVITATTQFMTETMEPSTQLGNGYRKPGVCPRIRSKDMQCPSQSECQRDSQCPGQQRCCYHACRKTVCVNPASREEVEAIRRRLYRPGKCPVLSRPSICPQNQKRVCNYDVDCKGAPDLKCCDNGCNKRCVPPVLSGNRPTAPPTDVRSGKCPPYSPNQKCPNLVQDDCTCDSDCGEDDKCCFDGCRRLCRKTAGKVCAASVDIIYLMDSSASIGPYEYEQEKSFVKDLARIFQIGASHAGVVVYSDYPQVEVKFDEKNDLESFAKAVDKIPFLGNRTRIDKALKAVAELFLTARKGVPKILIVLTDGRQTKDPDTVPLLEASQPLRDQGVKTYAVGVGHHIDKDELRAMVEHSSDVFYVGSFQELIRQSQTIAEEACKGAERLCTRSADVGFLVDASESISKEDFQKQKDAVNTMAKDFLESSADSRAGVMLYSAQPELSIDFGEYSSNEDLYNRVNALPHRRSHTRTDLALKSAATTLFASPRSNVPNILIVFTDGIQTPGSGVESLDKAVEPLRQKGVRVFAVSVGSAVDVKELNSMVQSPQDVFQVGSFSELVEKASKLSQATCPAPSPIATSTPQPQPTITSVVPTTIALPRPSCSKLLDIVFVMDSSRSIDGGDYIKEKNFVKELATIFKVGSGSRASVIIYSDDPELRIRFDEFNNLRDFSNAVDRLPFIMKRTRIDKALRMASDVLKGARVGFPKAVILMTDGIQSRDSDAMSLNRAADYIHEQGARMLVVGIGPKIVRDELDLMVKSPSHVFTVESFDSLIRAARNVAVSTCSTPVQNPNTQAPKGSCPNNPRPTRCSSFVDKCLDDKSCFGDNKCCYDGCRYLCTDPVLPTTDAPASLPVVKPGVCPSGSSRSDCAESFFDLCKNDRSCSNEDKCCFDGCRYTCRTPQAGSGQTTDAPIQLGPDSKCSEMFDLAFAMDSSSSILEPNYKTEKEFVKDLAGEFTIGKVQLGLVLFSDAPLLFVRFGGASSTSLDEFNNAVDRLPYLRGRTQIDKALQAGAHLFRGGRPNVPKALVLITDGLQPGESHSTPLREAAKKLRDNNVKILVVGVGPHVDKRELGLIVDNTSTDVFWASSFQDLQALNSKIETVLCSAMGTQPRRRS